MNAIALRPRFHPYMQGRFRLSLGLKTLVDEDWIEPDDEFVSELAEKDCLLHERRDEVVQVRPGSETAQGEVLELLVAHMARHHPGILIGDGDRITVRPIGRTYRLSQWRKAPIDLAGRLVQEDFCLMAPGPEGYTLEAASLCFPSRWRLCEKMGQVMRVIHDPVPGFDSRLAVPVDRFFSHLRVDRPVWRVNWSVNDDPRLFQPVRRQSATVDPEITEENAGSKLFIRCERQALHRLRRTGWILFTIKTHVDPVCTLEANPDAATALASALRDMPDAMRRYKNIAPFETPLLAWLDRVSCETAGR